MISTIKKDADVGKLVQFVSYDSESPWHKSIEKENLVLGGVYIVNSEDDSLSEGNPLQKVLSVTGKVESDIFLLVEQVHYLDSEKFI